MSRVRFPLARRRTQSASGLLLALSLLLACGGAPAASPTATAPSPQPATAPPAATGGAPATPPASSGVQPPLVPPVRVRVGVIGIAAEAGIYIAYEKGYFNAEGLEVDLQPFRGGAEQIPLLATGQLDFGASGPEPSLFNAVLRDADIKIVAPNVSLDERSASSALVVRSGEEIRTGADLAGRTVALNTEGGSVQVYLDRILAAGGLTLADVKVTALPFADMMTGLANGAIDAAWEVEPFVTISGRQRTAQVLYLVGQVYPGSIANVLLLSPVFAREHDEAARRFVTAYLRGQRDYYRAFVKDEGGRDEIIQALIKHTAVKDAGLYASLGMHGVDPNGALPRQSFEEYQEYFLKYGTQQQRVDFDRVLDRSYVDAALQRLGRMTE